MTARTVRPFEVSGALAEMRPPACRSVKLKVLPNSDSDSTRLEDILQAILTEVVTGWPDGATWIVDLPGAYLQGITYTPTCLIEFAPPPPTAELWNRAKAAGWLDPATVPREHKDFESRAVWGNNPVQEVSFASTGIPGIVALLTDAVDAQLLIPRGGGLDVQLFCNREDDATDLPAHTEADLVSSLPMRAGSALPALVGLAGSSGALPLITA